MQQQNSLQLKARDLFVQTAQHESGYPNFKYISKREKGRSTKIDALKLSKNVYSVSLKIIESNYEGSYRESNPLWCSPALSIKSVL